ncbi:MAG: hypothetical protein ABR506_13010, partial [Candidatus Krumholzibacteriia bacterium]
AREVPNVVWGEPAQAEAARAFAEAFADGGHFNLLQGGRPPRDLPLSSTQANLLLNPSPEVAAEYRRPELAIAGRTLVLEGRRYNLDEYDLVYTTANPDRPDLTDLVVVCGSPARLAALGGRLGHYGKYSWLLLPVGQGRVLRGNWAPAASPLTASR